MSFIIIPPDGAIADYVSHFWVGNWGEANIRDTTYYMTASSVTELAFFYKSPAGGKTDFLYSSVQGATERSAQFPAGSFSEMFGVSVYSHAVPTFFNIAPSGIKDRFFSLASLLGDAGAFLNEKIAQAHSTRDRVNILTGYFKSQLNRNAYADERMIAAARYIRSRNGVINVADLSAQCCLCQKQFTRRFEAYAGFNPKLYARIVRFEAVLRSHRNFASLTEASHASGYYDQAHFIHEFRKFSGYSPSQFFALSGY